ncbi:MAG: hypothetical protein EOP54_13370 [Sphingobacteriales bacterium]|nr:MAG: hypothetical protein EOP54_13370 [Sphingobacteriales bacterium]
MQDGIKNYFSVLYYVEYDHNNHFSGMHYPFGDHMLFTDNMPLFSVLVKSINEIIPGFNKYTIGLMNGAMILSIPFSAHFIYKILTHYKVGSIFAVIAAVFIAYFSPQIIKLYAHYGMAFMFYIPAVIYYLVKYFATTHRKYLLYILLTGILMSFIHLYNAAIIVVLLGFTGIALVATQTQFNLKKRLKCGLYIWTLGILIFVPITIYLKATDTLSDRPTYPYATLSNETTLKDIFVNDTPLGHLLQFAVGHTTGIVGSEGKTYIGLVSILVLLTAGFLYLKQLKSKQKWNNPYQPDTKLWLLVALFQILLAMGIPFNIDKDFFADHLSVLRNFRTLGRFAWPFYYIIMIFCSILIYNFFIHLLSKGKARLAYIFITSCVTIWAIQLVGPIKTMQHISPRAQENYAYFYDINDTSWASWLDARGLKAADFQAILGLPFYHIGSEKIYIMGVNEDFNQFELCKLSTQTGLPIINSMLSRNSWAQTFELIQIIDGKFNHKDILNRFSNKPLILLLDKNTPLKDKEQEWIEYAKYLGDRNENYAVYSVDPKQVQQADAAYRKALITEISSINRQDGLLENQEDTFFYTNNFAARNKEKGFADAGKFIPSKAVDDIIDTIWLPQSVTQPEFIFSLWVQCNLYDFRMPYFEIFQFDANGKQTAFSDYNAKQSTHVIDDWFLTEGTVKIDSRTSYIVIRAQAGDKKIIYKGADNLAIYPKQSVYYYKSTNRGLLLNNRPQ